ncbi:MAG TPA: FtsQ-type POTRA domain-containing protein [Candidatus Polarisedimenticolia bacterium]|nr:FtsQ-type POTRA domain-containing protein [Candidatus Polarisedimenticolia bacterium]
MTGARRQGQLKDELRYLRRDGNRMVRARRRRRTVLRAAIIVLMWGAGAAAVATAATWTVGWAMGPGQFALETVVVKGNVEALESEIDGLLQEWHGRNLLAITLTEVEKKVREHPWIGSSGGVRIQRKLPASLLVTVRERVASGCAMVDGACYLLDEMGMPIDRYGPRYARYDFPIIKGLDRLRVARKDGSGGSAALREALLAGVRATRSLAERRPGFYDQVSEIDVSDPAMIVLRLEGEKYDLRLSREELLQNLDNYFRLRDELSNAGGAGIEYVDLRWQDRIAVMPALEVRGPASGRADKEGRGGR